MSGRRLRAFVGTSAGSIVAARAGLRTLAAAARGRGRARAGPRPRARARAPRGRAVGWGRRRRLPRWPSPQRSPRRAPPRARSRWDGGRSAAARGPTCTSAWPTGGARFDGRLRVGRSTGPTARASCSVSPAPRRRASPSRGGLVLDPRVFNPVRIGGRDYVDGGAWSVTNLDAAPAVPRHPRAVPRADGRPRPSQRRLPRRDRDRAAGAPPPASPGPARHARPRLRGAVGMLMRPAAAQGDRGGLEQGLALAAAKNRSTTCRTTPARRSTSAISTYSSTACARSIPVVPHITVGMPWAVQRRMSAPHGTPAKPPPATSRTSCANGCAVSVRAAWSARPRPSARPPARPRPASRPRRRRSSPPPAPGAGTRTPAGPGPCWPTLRPRSVPTTSGYGSSSARMSSSATSASSARSCSASAACTGRSRRSPNGRAGAPPRRGHAGDDALDGERSALGAHASRTPSARDQARRVLAVALELGGQPGRRPPRRRRSAAPPRVRVTAAASPWIAAMTPAFMSTLPRPWTRPFSDSAREGVVRPFLGADLDDVHATAQREPRVRFPPG